MKYQQFLKTWPHPVITTHQFGLISLQLPQAQQVTKLSRWVHAGHLTRIKRGLYLINDRPINDFTLASLIYPHSYLTAETVLSHHSLIPDVAVGFTSATTTTTNQFATKQGIYLYSKLPSELYFGFEPIADSFNPKIHFSMANPEKALLDWIYLRRLSALDSSRVNISDFNDALLSKYLKRFPAWVGKVVVQCKS